MKKDDLFNFWAPLITAVFFFAVITFCAPCCFGAEMEIVEEPFDTLLDSAEMDGGFYSLLAEELGIVRIYEPDELTAEILGARKGNGYIIIEKIIGICLDQNGNGRIINTADQYYNYISYRASKNVHRGDVVLTYCIYNPDTDGEDDIIERFDYVIDTGQLITEN